MIAVMFLASPAVPAATGDAAPAAGPFDAIGSHIRGNAEIYAHFEACPADIVMTARPLWNSQWVSSDRSERQCEGDLDACLADCTEWRNENACFALARVLEDAEPLVSPILSQMLYAQACALGHPGGCTNRAAGIRNGQFDGDPMGKAAPEVLSSCYFRTFAISCDDGDAWGCAMLGQSYQIGEGVAQSAGEARRYLLRSCEIDPDFAACDFARSLMPVSDGEAR
jgi:hypothetical protein